MATQRTDFPGLPDAEFRRLPVRVPSTTAKGSATDPKAPAKPPRPGARAGLPAPNK
jgi:hypothetical protein